LLGNSAAIERVRERLKNAATTEAPVLLTGESGTGKDLAANLLHQWSRRRSQAFVKVNCPAIPGPLFESEVFGHEAGAFTGAKKAKPGKLEQANHGTLFLDEIGELDMSLQSKLLHALQDFHVVRLGAVDERKVDVRLICATNRNLDVEIANGNFRADLFYRINVLKIEMPSLRERASDIPALVSHFIQHYGDLFNRRPEPVSSSFMRLLQAYHWPGNIRELENLAKRYVVLGGEEHVVSSLREPEEFNPMSLETIDINTPLRVQTKKAVQHLERRIILRVLQAHKWNRRKTARSLDISYRALLYKIKDAGLPPIRTVKASVRKVESEGQEGIQ
jgi:two-component system response regulator AtoC